MSNPSLRSSPCEQCGKATDHCRCALWREWVCLAWGQLGQQLGQSQDAVAHPEDPGGELWDFYLRTRHVVGPLTRGRQRQ